MILMSALTDIGNFIMTPFYWLISSLLIFFHWLLTPLFGGIDNHAGQGWVWLLAIILMTCVIRGIMLPLYAKQLNSQRAMTALQPKMKELQKKYAGDRQRQSAETMKLYQDAGVSPYASCLPMLIQLPVFMSVFWTIRGIAYNWLDAPLKGMFAQYQIYHPNDKLPAPAAPHLPSPDGSAIRDSFMNASILGVKLSETGVDAWKVQNVGTVIFIVILVLLMMGTLFYQQWYMMRRNMPPTMLEGPMGQQQKIMLYIFPFMYLFSGAYMPMGILMYWLVSNVWTMGQQYVMVRIYPTPDTPAYAEWEDRMIAKGKDPVEIERARIEKAKSKKKPGGGLGAKIAQMAGMQTGATQSAATEAETTTEVVKAPDRQVVTRKDPNTGKQIVVRQQPKSKSRAKRKH